MTRNKTEFFLILVTENTSTLLQQTQTIVQGTLDFKITNSRDSFSLNVPLQLENGEWALGLTYLKVYSFPLKKSKKYFLFNTTIEKKSIRKI